MPSNKVMKTSPGAGKKKLVVCPEVVPKYQPTNNMTPSMSGGTIENKRPGSFNHEERVFLTRFSLADKVALLRASVCSCTPNCTSSVVEVVTLIDIPRS